MYEKEYGEHHSKIVYTFLRARFLQTLNLLYFIRTHREQRR